MRVTQPGEIAPGLHFLGSPAILVYLIEGRQRALVDAGMSLMGPMLRRALDPFGGFGALDWHLLTHSHYDHIGCTPLICRERPGIRVGAHPRVGEIVNRPGAIELIRKLNASVAGGRLPEDPDIVEFDGFEVTDPLDDGATIDLDGVTVEAVWAPGHTRDSIAFYLPDQRAIIPGEAGGVPDFQGRIMPEFLQDIDAYVASLEKMAALEVEWVCLPHNYVLGGDAARHYFADSIEATHHFRGLIEQALDRANGDVDKAIAELAEALYQPGGQPRDAFMINLAAMTRVVARSAT